MSQCSRRDFIKRVGFIAAALPAVKLLNSAISVPSAWAGLPALPAGKQAISESDSVASVVGYKHEVKDIDYKKYPRRKEAASKNQFCNSCQLYTTVDKNWGSCQLLAAGLVHAKGWCGSWSKKT